MSSFDEILARPTVFRDRNVMSPHYIPEVLPHREREIDTVMRALFPAIKGDRPRNLFLYGKTGTGKTSSSRLVVERLLKASGSIRSSYINCRIYNSRYRVLQKIVKDHMPDQDKPGYGLSYYYEKILDWIRADGKGLILVLDEIDVVKDLDDLAYTLTRSNDEPGKGFLSILGISNKLSFKDRLDPRSRSSLFETELVFSPYTSSQLREILKQRSGLGFRENGVRESAINLASAIAAQDNGDARYALKLLLRAGEIADELGVQAIEDAHVESARKAVDEDISFEAISTLPRHQQLVLYAVASLEMEGSRYVRLDGNGNNSSNGLLSGEVYGRYVQSARAFGAEARTARWYRDYLSDLELLGLITMTESGKGQRGHTRFIQLEYAPDKVKSLVEKQFLGE